MNLAIGLHRAQQAAVAGEFGHSESEGFGREGRVSMKGIHG